MEIGARTILIFLALALYRWNDSERFMCFIETLMIINAWQWIHRLFGFMVGQNNEEILMERIRNVENKVKDVAVMCWHTVVATIYFLVNFLRGKTFPPVDHESV